MRSDSDRDNEFQNPPGETVLGGNLERVLVKSGSVLIIDQFMLANRQFVAAGRGEVDGSDTEPAEPLLAAVRSKASMFGGCILDFVPGTYHVWRDAIRSVMVVYRADSSGNVAGPDAALGDADGRTEPAPFHVAGLDIDEILRDRSPYPRIGRVFVDTRCLVFIDLAILSESDRLSEYGTLRRDLNDKQARDLLRNAGAAVRYGFSRYGDELGVYRLDENAVALWPDVVD